MQELGGFTAVDDVNLEVRRGSIHALIGPNGAGKTTCFNLLTKFLAPSKGAIVSTAGISPATGRTRSRAGAGALVPDFRGVFRPQRADNVRLALQRKRGRSFDFWRSEKALRPINDAAMELHEEVGHAQVADLSAKELAYGRKRTLELATTLALEPKMLLLDEPMAGMGHEDLAGRGLIRKAAVNRTILMVEHNLCVVAALSDRITVLARGKVLAEGDYETCARTRP